MLRYIHRLLRSNDRPIPNVQTISVRWHICLSCDFCVNISTLLYQHHYVKDICPVKLHVKTLGNTVLPHLKLDGQKLSVFKTSGKSFFITKKSNPLCPYKEATPQVNIYIWVSYNIEYRWKLRLHQKKEECA